MLSNFSKVYKTSLVKPQYAMFSFELQSKNKLHLKRKFHNNKNVPDLFKNSKTDDYVSQFHWVTLFIFRSEGTSVMIDMRRNRCLNRLVCLPSTSWLKRLYPSRSSSTTMSCSKWVKANSNQSTPATLSWDTWPESQRLTKSTGLTRDKDTTQVFCPLLFSVIYLKTQSGTLLTLLIKLRSLRVVSRVSSTSKRWSLT